MSFEHNIIPIIQRITRLLTTVRWRNSRCRTTWKENSTYC